MTPAKYAIFMLLRCLSTDPVDHRVCTEAVVAAQQVPGLAVYAELGRQELAR